MRHRFHGREILFRKRTRMFHLSNKSTPLVLAVFLQAKFAILQIAASGQLYLIVCTLNCHRRFNSIHTMSPYIDIYTRYPTRGIWALSWHPSAQQILSVPSPLYHCLKGVYSGDLLAPQQLLILFLILPWRLSQLGCE